jgi:glyoxylase-like metal-dependent hydrolase (beta-lactamase superfamily II)
VTGRPASLRRLGRLLAVAVAAGTIAATPAQVLTPHVDLQKIADGVYAAIRKEPPGLMFNANSVFIVNDDGVVVVDTNMTPTSARETLAALRSVTTRRVTTVVNTHWHEDHMLGNQVFRDEFPGVEFIGHTSVVSDLPVAGAAQRRQMLDLGPRMVTQFQLSLEQHKSLGGGLLTDEERASYLSDIAAAEQYAADAPLTQIVMPTRTVDERLTLVRGNRTIDIRHLGKGHTSGDLIVHLPRERIVVAGDLVVWPTPVVGSSSHPLEFGATIERLIALDPATIVPGHGPVMHDSEYPKQVVRLLSSLTTQVGAAVSRGDTLEQTRRAVQLGEFRKVFARDSQLVGYLFDSYVASPGVAAAYRAVLARAGG